MVKAHRNRKPSFDRLQSRCEKVETRGSILYRLTTYSYFVVECPEIEREEDFS